jgi:hypothetical protein
MATPEEMATVFSRMALKEARGEKRWHGRPA